MRDEVKRRTNRWFIEHYPASISHTVNEIRQMFINEMIGELNALKSECGVPKHSYRKDMTAVIRLADTLYKQNLTKRQAEKATWAIK